MVSMLLTLLLDIKLKMLKIVFLALHEKTIKRFEKD